VAEFKEIFAQQSAGLLNFSARKKHHLNASAKIKAHLYSLHSPAKTFVCIAYIWVAGNTRKGSGKMGSFLTQSKGLPGLSRFYNRRFIGAD